MANKCKSHQDKSKMSEIDDNIAKLFEIKKRLGKGAYGIVWKAMDRRSNETLAVKKIFDAFRDETDAQRTFREIVFLKAFRNHPHVVQLHNVYKATNNLDIYLTFEYMESDLHNIINKGTILKDVHKRYVMYQIINAIKYIHSGNVIHRDLKPSNVLIDSKCRCKLADFGLARSVSNKPLGENNDLNNDLVVEQLLTDYVATRWYRAPEILIASKRYTKGIDMWSLGCILGEMIRGKPLFQGSSTVDQIEKIVSTMPEITEEDIQAVGAGFGSALLNKQISTERKTSLDEILDNTCPEAVTLVKSLLILDPLRRLTAVEALNHDYVAKFRNPLEEMDLLIDVLPPFRDDVRLTVPEYRAKLYEIVRLDIPDKSKNNYNSSQTHNVQKQRATIDQDARMELLRAKIRSKKTISAPQEPAAVFRKIPSNTNIKKITYRHNSLVPNRYQSSSHPIEGKAIIQSRMDRCLSVLKANNQMKSNGDFQIRTNSKEKTLLKHIEKRSTSLNADESEFRKSPNAHGLHKKNNSGEALKGRSSSLQKVEIGLQNDHHHHHHQHHQKGQKGYSKSEEVVRERHRIITHYKVDENVYDRQIDRTLERTKSFDLDKPIKRQSGSEESNEKYANNLNFKMDVNHLQNDKNSVYESCDAGNGEPNYIYERNLETKQSEKILQRNPELSQTVNLAKVEKIMNVRPTKSEEMPVTKTNLIDDACYERRLKKLEEEIEKYKKEVKTFCGGSNLKPDGLSQSVQERPPNINIITVFPKHTSLPTIVQHTNTPKKNEFFHMLSRAHREIKKIEKGISNEQVIRLNPKAPNHVNKYINASQKSELLQKHYVENPDYQHQYQHSASRHIHHSHPHNHNIPIRPKTISKSVKTSFD